MNNWAICFILRDGEYDWAEAGRNIVITEEYDKVIPVEENVARQVDKLVYDGKTLRLREGEILLSTKELDRQQFEEDKRNGLLDEHPSEPKLVEVDI